MSIHIVTHAYAGNLPQYAVFLKAQLSSLVLYPPTVDTKITVCYCPEDDLVTEVLSEMRQLMERGMLIRLPLPKGALFRRSIGRNEVALLQKADIVWFTDVDHFFHAGCLNQLQCIWDDFGKDRPVLTYPMDLLVHKNHEIGDKFCETYKDFPGLVDINAGPDCFSNKNNNRAIGGIQIANGGFVRKFGYLNNLPKWRRPADGMKPFPDFRDDVKFRHYCSGHGRVEPIELPGLYRLRHTEVTYK